MESNPQLAYQYLHHFKSPIDEMQLPEQFTFPYAYEPSPIALLAVRELQEDFLHQRKWDEHFGDYEYENGEICGKMFGVLVVQNINKEVGYLSAFSGKLMGKTHQMPFVGPVYDRLTDQGFFKSEEQVITAINQKLLAIKADPDYLALQVIYSQQQQKAHFETNKSLMHKKESKRLRQIWREQALNTLDNDQLLPLMKQLSAESQDLHYRHKRLINEWRAVLEGIQKQLEVHGMQIDELKLERKKRSIALQQRLFDQYQFLNKNGETKGLSTLFSNTKQQRPPAGAGDCAAPKLLQYAFLNQLKPIAMAEFWWGQSPRLQLRKHGHFYPACLGKCKPILAHMLEDIPIDQNPAYEHSIATPGLEILYQNEQFLIINKPNGLLSVPGKYVLDSVASRVRLMYPTATGPLIVHRLDRETSGVMVVTKTIEAYHHLQNQFLTKTIKKRYEALLGGVLSEKEGTIELPLRPDHHQRPRQMVCFEKGKDSATKWKVLEVKEGETRVSFEPFTGRTHQIRVHAAHPDGLNLPIIGDALYGTKADRLMLHARSIKFLNPSDDQWVHFQIDPNF
jgi:tRNA pseudouridine32 synthase / 23S rRNA pseudouridine746 synthase